MLQIDARIDRHFHVEHRDVAGPNREAIGRRRALTVEQGVHHNRVGIRCRLFDPECLEQGEFFPFCVAGVDRESPGGQAVNFSLCHRAKIACAKEGDHLVQAIARAGPSVNANSDLNKVELRRTMPDGSIKVTTVNLYDVLRSGNASRDPVLQKGDVVYVPTAKKKPDLLSPLTTLLFLLPRL